MNTRMERYNDIQETNMSRTKRNEHIYSSNDMEELSRFKSNANVSIISDAPKEINIEKIKSYLDSIDDKKEEKRNRLDVELNEIEDEQVLREDTRTYDINSVLELAKESKRNDYEEERHRKINNTQYDILKSIKITDEEKEENSNDLNTQEKTIVDLIQNIQNNSSKKEKVELEAKDLFKDLMSDNENTVVMAPITEDEINKENMKEALNEITTDLEKIKEPINDKTQDLILEKEKLKMDQEKELNNTDTINTTKLNSIDKSFYTNSMSFSKTDFEGFEDLDDKDERSSVFTKLAIVFAIILLIVTILLILNFVLDWNII